MLGMPPTQLKDGKITEGDRRRVEWEWKKYLAVVAKWTRETGLLDIK